LAANLQGGRYTISNILGACAQALGVAGAAQLPRPYPMKAVTALLTDPESQNVYENRLGPVAHPPSGVRFGPSCIPHTNRSAEGGRATEFSYTF